MRKDLTIEPYDFVYFTCDLVVDSSILVHHSRDEHRYKYIMYHVKASAFFCPVAH